MKKNNMSRSGLMRTLAVAALLLSVGLLPASAVTILSDTFSTGAAGAALNGAAVESYDSGSYGSAPLWVANVNTKYSGSGTITTAVAAQTLEGRIAITDPVSSIYSVQASITTNTADWVAIGFLGTTNISSATWTASNGALLWVYMRPDSLGNWVLYREGTASVLKTGNVKALLGSYSGSSAYTLTLNYNPTSMQANMLINGVDATNGWFNVSWSGGVDPTFAGAGFRENAVAGTIVGGPIIDDFSVTSVPEPSVAALLVVAASCGFFLRRKTVS